MIFEIKIEGVIVFMFWNSNGVIYLILIEDVVNKYWYMFKRIMVIFYILSELCFIVSYVERDVFFFLCV